MLGTLWPSVLESPVYWVFARYLPGPWAARIDVEDLKTSSHLGLGEERSPLELLVHVLIEDSCVVLARIFAAFNHEQHQGVELGVCVLGVVSMSRGLFAR